MGSDVTFIGTFQIPDEDAWRPAIDQMTEFVRANVPRLLSFHAYASSDGTEGTVIYVHPDGASLDQHLKAAAELIQAGTEMVRVSRIELLGEPNAETVERIRATGAPVSVKHHVVGFTR